MPVITMTLQVQQQQVIQGTKETLAWVLTTTAFASNPTVPSNKLYDITTDPAMQTPSSWVDVSATKLTGAASVSGDLFTSQAVTALVNGSLYRLEYIFTVSGNIFEAFVVIKCIP